MAYIWSFVVFVFSLEVVKSQELRCPNGISSDQCEYKSNSIGEYFFTVKGSELKIEYEARYFQLTCPPNTTLESEYLPKFDRPTSIPKVTFTSCDPPGRSYESILLSFNIINVETLWLDKLAVSSPLSSHHFSGLNITALRVSAPQLLQSEVGFLESLNSLLNLRLLKINLSLPALLHLPVNIKWLSLVQCNLSAVDDEVLRRLPGIERLVLNDASLQNARLSGAVSLRNVEVAAPLLNITLPVDVENATFYTILTGPGEVGCGNLRHLVLHSVTTSVVTAWGQHCTGLHSLHVLMSRMEQLSGGDLPATLRLLAIKNSRLQRLTPDSLVATTQLRNLDLSNNKIVSLPRDIFVSAQHIESIDLSNNQLSIESVSALSSLRSLRKLDLSRNPLTDLCRSDNDNASATYTYVPNAMSDLWQCRSLVSLRLKQVGATRLCADWRRHLTALTELDLRSNNLTLVEYDDLQWERESTTRVDLRGNPILTVRYLRGEYENDVAQAHDNATAAPLSTPLTTIVINSMLECDCGMYWYARALREGVARGAALEGAQCGGETALGSMPLELFVCEVEAPACPAPCHCVVSGEGADMSCNNASLTRPPPPATLHLPPVRNLALRHNLIDTLDPADIPSNVTMLDLSYNRIARVETAWFTNGTREVLLAGNPLECSCERAGALLALRDLVPDWEAVRCADGARPAPCDTAPRSMPALPALLVSLVALGVVAAMFLLHYARPTFTYRLKMYLVDHGLCSRWARDVSDAEAGAAEEDEEAIYDAFISFSHHDDEYASTLATTLESPPHQMRLCLHHRDWLPGELITDQIVRSIRRSRRTVVLVSDWFVQSSWARAEFRSAFTHALSSTRARPPLALLLPSLSMPRDRLARDLDPELALYLANNTYLEWSDPALWDKLPRALRQS